MTHEQMLASVEDAVRKAVPEIIERTCGQCANVFHPLLAVFSLGCFLGMYSLSMLANL